MRTPFAALSCSLFLLAGSAVAVAADLSERYVVEVHRPERVYAGTTIFTDTTDPLAPVIVEVDMAGKVIWSYAMARSDHDDMDVEWIPQSDHILFTQSSGVYEVDRSGKIVWSHKAPSSHDADRLANGNTLVVWGWGTDSASPEVREVDPSGKLVWAWHAAEHLKGERRIFAQEGFTHTNSATRLGNGNTLISLRNFFMLVEVDPAGRIVWKLSDLYTTPHDPEILANGNILVNTRMPQVITEFTPAGRIVWQYQPDQNEVNTVRSVHRLPNGNTILSERTKIIEITPEREIVWQLRLKNVDRGMQDRGRHLYKVERIPLDKTPFAAPVYVAPSETLKRSGESMLSADERNRDVVRMRVPDLFKRMDADRDGRIARSEFTGQAPFEAFDTNEDGFISFDEAVEFFYKQMMAQRRRTFPPL
jgi:outer membrane protein assembly factor BamB